MTTSTESTVQKIERGDDLARGRELAAEHRRRLEALAELFPGVLTETVNDDGQTVPAIDADALRDLVGATVDSDTREKFGLSWHGKAAARRLALTPSAGTLRPAPGESVEWDTTQNAVIEGDNLEVLKLLQKAYAGRVKLIYIDPPYNTGKDFVYKDNFRDPIGHYQRLTGQVGDDGEKLTSNAESSGRFHTDWLNMIYPRLLLARELLREDGVIFVSIDENEHTNLRAVMDDVFGGENFVADMVWAAGRKNDSKLISVSHEYIVCYARSREYLKNNSIVWRQRKKGLDDIYKHHDKLKRKHGDDFDAITHGMKQWFKSLSDADPAKSHRHYAHADQRGLYFPDNISWPGGGGPKYEVLHPVTQRPVKIPSRGWMTSDPAKMAKWIEDDRVHFGDDESSVPCIKSHLKDREQQTPYSVFYKDGRAATKRLRELMDGDEFDFPKDESVIREIVEMISAGDDIVLDFFAGSGTTGHAVMEQNAADGGNRRYVLVQLPEPTGREDYPTIADLTKERLRRAGAKIKAEHGDKLFERDTPLDTGFRVFKLDSANVKAWEAPTTDELDEQTATTLIEGAIDAVKPGRSDADLLWGAMLNLGLPLDGQIDEREVDGKQVYVAGAGTLLACFADTIDRDGGEKLAAGCAEIIDDLGVEGEVTVLLRDSAFDGPSGGDATKVNLVENLRQRMPDGTTVRVRSI